MTPTPSSNDALATIPSDRLWLRSELMGTQVITRDTGRRLGVVGEVIVDIDRREVVAVGLRDNPLTRFLPGLPRWMPLDRIRQVGDVTSLMKLILVASSALATYLVISELSGDITRNGFSVRRNGR